MHTRHADETTALITPLVTPLAPVPDGTFPENSQIEIAVTQEEQDLALLKIHHDVFSMLYDIEHQKKVTDENNKKIYYAKISLGVLLLMLRATSILFRFYAAKQFFIEFMKLPELDRISNDTKNTIALSLSSIFFATDLVVTLRSTKKAVFRIFASAEWAEKSKQFLMELREGKYPKGLLLSFSSAMLGSAMKGYSGVLTMFSEELADIPYVGHYLKKSSSTLSFFSAASSGICFSLFQFFDKACYVLQANEALHNSESGRKFLEDNQELIKTKNRQGMMLNIGAGLFSAISIFYSEGHFEFSPAKLALFFVVAVGTVYFNYHYSYNAIHRLSVFKRMHENETCDRCEDTTATKERVLTKIVGTVSAIGDASAYMISVVKTFQVIFRLIGLVKNDEQTWQNYANNQWAMLAFFLCATPIAVPAGLQGWDFWTGGLVKNRKPKMERNDNSDTASMVSEVNLRRNDTVSGFVLN